VKESGYFSDVVEMPGQDDEGDGSVTIDADDEISSLLEDEGAERGSLSTEFDANLADDLDDSELMQIGQRLHDYVQVDMEARTAWATAMKTGLQIIGVDDIPEDASAFDGAARVTHPAMAEAIVQFQARAMEELLPPGGPVKATIHGETTDELKAQSKRLEDAMNYQLTEGDDQYYWDTDSMLFYLPYAGSAFKKIAPDPVTGMTRSRFVRGEDMIVPYSATSLADSPRYTHRYPITRNDYLRAVDRGFFKDVDLPEVGASGSISVEGRELADKADDRQPAQTEDDSEYVFYETHIDLEFSKTDPLSGEKPFRLPYCVTFEKDTQKVVRISRLWMEDDDQFKKVVWFTHHKFLPGLGFYGFGYLHLIGSLGRAASGALRAVLDGSTTASLQGGFKSREARGVGSMQFEPGVWQDVDMSAEELAKSFYTPPFKEPSPALFNTLQLLIEGIQRFASTSENMVGEASNTGPVGTTVALIEQGSKVYSGIHRRLHLAARQEFKLIMMCNFRYMSGESYTYRAGGAPHTIARADFGLNVDIIPVSDPNIFSSTQRIALAQAVVADVDANPDIYTKQSKVRAHRMLLEALKVPEIDTLLPPGELIKRADPITENQRAMVGAPLKAYPEQDHLSHLQLHGSMIAELMAGDPEIATNVVPILKAHLAEHLAWAYRQRISAELQAKTGVPLPPIDANMEGEELPIEVENAVAQTLAAVIEPPAPPQPQQDPAIADAQRKADRDDLLAERKMRREDIAHAAKLRREGLVDDETFASMTAPQQPLQEPAI
jgi:hypothetical protein